MRHTKDANRFTYFTILQQSPARLTFIQKIYDLYDKSCSVNIIAHILADKYNLRYEDGALEKENNQRSN